MDAQPTTQQISVAEIATALGTENLVLRLVQLQRRVEELEGQLAARPDDQPRPAPDLERLIAQGPIPNGR